MMSKCVAEKDPYEVSVSPEATPRVPDHRTFRDDLFWQEIPAWANVSEDNFADHTWQSKNSVKTPEDLVRVLGHRLKPAFLEDVRRGLEITPMNVRMTPYIFALIDWDQPWEDPLRKQFLPVASQFLPDHPFKVADSLGEDSDSPVPMITHRYPDKVLFLPLSICPVYCSYCTRSRLIGGSTESVQKDSYGPRAGQWEAAFDYIRTHPAVEDVVISGGDAFNLRPEHVTYIGEQLLSIPHIRRFRYATKGIAIFPMKILTDDKWYEALRGVVTLGRTLGKQVFVHTHFSSPREITVWNQRAMARLFSDAIVVRNQAVLQEGVNNTKEQMILLTRQLSYMNIQPYYVYQHDMVPGVEHFRTKVEENMQLEKEVRGTTAGFNTPNFVCDLPGGGGKRQIDSFEHYNRETGISAWTAPTVKPGELFFYFDPIHRLDPAIQKRWTHPAERGTMVEDVVRRVREKGVVFDEQRLAGKLKVLFDRNTAL